MRTISPATLSTDAYAILRADAPIPLPFASAWDDLVTDAYMKPGDTYRERRYARFAIAPDGAITRLPHRPFTQSAAINAYAGATPRDFAPMQNAIANASTLADLLRADAALLASAIPTPPEGWHIDAHQVRTIATDQREGRPSPEGPHRDGMTAVVVHLINPFTAQGGETIVADNASSTIARFTLTNPGDAYAVLDERVLHDVTPIRVAPAQHRATRDTILFGFRPFTEDLNRDDYAYGD